MFAARTAAHQHLVTVQPGADDSGPGERRCRQVDEVGRLEQRRQRLWNNGRGKAGGRGQGKAEREVREKQGKRSRTGSEEVKDRQ